ncbi:hypothetical protein PYW07_017455 [Mythimna separata]|uniref:Uncharacterized protein n=1 Tax=Mythimna separata TaxID=271217 RepID=A0AAD7YY36_MYTSE|nr:hypothetical protein PYW07_017455 [Mythimna separata]
MGDDSTRYLYEDSSRSWVWSTDSSNPKPSDTFSVFGSEACGEPLQAQHVIMDFTPNAEDKEFTQQKVCSFWKFINNIPGIQNLKVEPEKNLYAGDSKTEVAPDSVKSEIDAGVEDSSVAGHGLGQAAHMLRFAEDKKLINTLFEAKLPQSMCSLGSREYKHGQPAPLPKKKEKKHVCKCIPCRNPKCRNKRPVGTPTEELSPLRALSRKMNEWDAKHPKSMEPPGHPPALQHCLIQRQMFPVPLDTVPRPRRNFC